MSTMRCDFSALKPMTAPFPTFSARKRRAAAAVRRRQMRLADLGLQRMLRQRGLDARDEVAAIGVVVDVLELTPAAFGKVTARRLLVMRSGRKRTVVEQRIARHAEGHMASACGHAVAARGDPDDRLAHSTSASACGMAAARSSAIMFGPAISAARPCSQTAAQAASNAGKPARAHCRNHSGKHVTGPRRRQPRRRRRSKAQRARPATRPACPAPCRRRPLRCAAPLPARAPPSCPPTRRTAAETRLRAA